MENTINEVKKGNFNILGYVAFVIAGLYFSISNPSDSNGPMFLMLAFIFDPFDVKVKWSDRKNWQKGLLITHLIVSFFFFVRMFF
jgi:hypothetical protein